MMRKKGPADVISRCPAQEVRKGEEEGGGGGGKKERKRGERDVRSSKQDLLK